MEDRINSARRVLLERFGFADFREPQKDVIASFVGSGRDTIAVMPTGGGKSLCYQVPGLLWPGTAVVVSPLISLMVDQTEALKKRGIRAACLHSGISRGDQQEILRRMVKGELDFIYLAPERLSNAEFRGAASRALLSLVAVDEAHCISTWGHDFRPEYRRISRAVARLRKSRQSRLPLIALTATATPDVVRDIAEQSGAVDPEIVIRGFDRPNLAFHVHHTESRRDTLLELVGVHERKNALHGPAPHEGSIIIYCASRKGVNNSLDLLHRHNLDARGYHGGMTGVDRDEVQRGFISNDFRILVATNAFGMGVDKPDVRRVIHYDMPDSMEAYYQEAGRAGRDGEPADCHLIYAPHDRRLHEFLMDASTPPVHVVQGVHSIIGGWEGDFFNPSMEALKTVVPGLKDAMIDSVYRVLEEEGVISRGDFMEPEGDMTRVARVENREVDIEPRMSRISQRRVAVMRMLEVMERYCRCDTCLTRFIVHYFGEHREDDCGRCGVCLKRAREREKQVDVTSQALACLRTVSQQSAKFGVRTLSRIMKGTSDLSSLTLDAHRMPHFGELSGADDEGIRDFIEGLVEDQYLVRKGDANGALVLSRKGCDVIRGDRKVRAMRGLGTPASPNSERSRADIVSDLKTLKEALSREYGVSPFTIWTPVVEKALLEASPKSVGELRGIKGVREYQVREFGDKIIAVFSG